MFLNDRRREEDIVDDQSRGKSNVKQLTRCYYHDLSLQQPTDGDRSLALSGSSVTDKNRRVSLSSREIFRQIASPVRVCAVSHTEGNKESMTVRNRPPRNHHSRIRVDTRAAPQVAQIRIERAKYRRRRHSYARVRWHGAAINSRLAVGVQQRDARKPEPSPCETRREFRALTPAITFRAARASRHRSLVLPRGQAVKVGRVRNS